MNDGVSRVGHNPEINYGTENIRTVISNIKSSFEFIEKVAERLNQEKL